MIERRSDQAGRVRDAWHDVTGSAANPANQRGAALRVAARL